MMQLVYFIITPCINTFRCVLKSRTVIKLFTGVPHVNTYIIWLYILSITRSLSHELQILKHLDLATDDTLIIIHVLCTFHYWLYTSTFPNGNIYILLQLCVHWRGGNHMAYWCSAWHSQLVNVLCKTLKMGQCSDECPNIYRNPIT